MICHHTVAFTDDLLGNCGYLDEHCKKSCVANCDAKAPCGLNSRDGQQICPLNVCCSHFGFCGASEAFCRDTTEYGLSTPCQKDFGKCGTVRKQATPACGKGSGTASRRIAYYEGWLVDPYTQVRTVVADVFKEHPS